MSGRKQHYRDMEKKNFSTFIKEQQGKRNLTNKELAKALGVNYTTFMTWVNGTALPRKDQIERVAQYFGSQFSQSYSGLALQDFNLPMPDEGLNMIGINKGDILHINRCDTIDNGKIVLAEYEGRYLVRKYYYFDAEKVLVLIPDNPDYEASIFTGEHMLQLKILGKITSYQKRL